MNYIPETVFLTIAAAGIVLLLARRQRHGADFARPAQRRANNLENLSPLKE